MKRSTVVIGGVALAILGAAIFVQGRYVYIPGLGVGDHIDGVTIFGRGAPPTTYPLLSWLAPKLRKMGSATAFPDGSRWVEVTPWRMMFGQAPVNYDHGRDLVLIEHVRIVTNPVGIRPGWRQSPGTFLANQQVLAEELYADLRPGPNNLAALGSPSLRREMKALNLQWIWVMVGSQGGSNGLEFLVNKNGATPFLNQSVWVQLATAPMYSRSAADQRRTEARLALQWAHSL